MAGASLVFLIIFFVIYGVILLASLAMSVLQIIATWKLYEKAGEPGWSSIVPVYNFMQQIKIATGSFKLAWIYLGMMIAYILCVFLYYVMSIVNEAYVALILELGIILVCTVILFGAAAIGMYTYYMFAKSYGKSQAFCILSIFFPQIMVIIMGFDKTTQYVGPKGVPQYNGYNKYY